MFNNIQDSVDNFLGNQGFPCVEHCDLMARGVIPQFQASKLSDEDPWAHAGCAAPDSSKEFPR